MSGAVNSTSTFYLQKIAIYMGAPVLVAGVIGGILNIIVFLSLQTFRQSSCAFYLTVMSFVNIGQLLTGLFSRVMITGSGIDWTLNSRFYCKFRQYCIQVCALISITCLCLATIDQYLATSFHPRWQHWSNIKVARRLSTIFAIVWLLHSIPCLIYFDLIPSISAEQMSCMMTNTVYSQYNTYGYGTIITGCLPVLITILFGSLAFYNVRRLAYRVVPLVRRELDKQLTVMVLILDIYNIIALIPYPIIVILMATLNSSQNAVIAANINFVNSVTIYTYYLYYACPFYIYVCTSERFRRQLIHVLFKIHLERWRRQRMVAVLTLPR